jgi:hypothetical protein
MHLDKKKGEGERSDSKIIKSANLFSWLLLVSQQQQQDEGHFLPVKAWLREDINSSWVVEFL